MKPALAPPQWMTWALLFAAAYNILWGAWVVLFPSQIFEISGAIPPQPIEIWQCVGMIVGVYGVGYAIAAFNPFVHWPIVLVGLLGKIFGPIGFVKALVQGVFPLSFAWTILTNDLIWWLPFFLILRGAYGHWLQEPARAFLPLDVVLDRTPDNATESLRSLSNQSPLLMVFLRHQGCTFCREALDDLQQQFAALQAQNVKLLLVHMSKDSAAAHFFAKYGLDHAYRISDPQREIYGTFHLRRGRLGQLLGLNVWFRGIQAGIFAGHGVGTLAGDGFQMPGVFLLHHGQIVQSFFHQDAADRPDYLSMIPKTVAA